MPMHLAERDANLAERDAMLAERDAMLDERDAALAQRDAALKAERELRMAMVVRAKTMELDAALASWVAEEHSLEAIAGSSTEQDADYMTSEVLAAIS